MSYRKLEVLIDVPTFLPHKKTQQHYVIVIKELWHHCQCMALSFETYIPLIWEEIIHLGRSTEWETCFIKMWSYITTKLISLSSCSIMNHGKTCFFGIWDVHVYVHVHHTNLFRMCKNNLVFHAHSKNAFWKIIMLQWAMQRNYSKVGQVLVLWIFGSGLGD